MNTHTSRRPPHRLSLATTTLLVTVLLAGFSGPLAQAASPPMTDAGGPGAGSSYEVSVSRLFRDVFSGNNAATCPELITDGAAIHTLDGEYRGHEGMSDFVGGLRNSFPDASFVLTELMASGDTIAVRWAMIDTHDGAYEDIAASGTTVRLDGLAILRFELGKVVEASVSYDRLQLLEQLVAGADAQDGPAEVCPPCQTPE